MTEIYESRLIAKRTVAEGTVEFRLARPEGLAYQAGQFFDIILPKPSEDAEQGSYKHGFSFVSAPFEPFIAMATRMRAGSKFKRALDALPIGAPLEVEAVWGDFVLRKKTNKAMVFLAGGIGITPVRSMIAEATHDHTEHRFVLFYVNRRPEEAAFTDELRALARENPRFTFVPVYTRAEVEGAEHGHVDAAMIRRHVADLDDAAFYTSGPRGMVFASRELLVSMDVDEDAIHTEEFEGY